MRSFDEASTASSPAFTGMSSPTVFLSATAIPENENNNTLKTVGYHFERNYGNGKQHLSAVLATLIMLAFLVHTILYLVDCGYRKARARRPSRRTFFEQLPALVQYLPFETWEHLFDFMLDGLAPAPR